MSNTRYRRNRRDERRYIHQKRKYLKRKYLKPCETQRSSPDVLRDLTTFSLLRQRVSHFLLAF